MAAKGSRATVDRAGVAVAEGTLVRVLAVPASVLERLEPKERDRVASMVGRAFKVYEVDEWGGAWVENWWQERGGRATSHSLGLRSSEMEVVKNDA
jgi:hypothetical protein